MTILDKIVETKKEEIIVAKRSVSERELLDRIALRSYPLSLRMALKKAPVGIIAEFKRKSPSKGFIQEGAKVEEVLPAYALAGASACSILTDSSYFGGSPEDLRQARKLVKLPLLRKDFIVDPYQIAEAAAWGADAILLIAAVLSVQQCREFTELAHRYGLEVLLEIHEESELDYISAKPDLVGVNNRNLKTFVTDIYTSLELAKQLPACILKISESGIYSMQTIRALQQVGYKGFLIGERFMKEKQPGLALKNLINDVD